MTRFLTAPHLLLAVIAAGAVWAPSSACAFSLKTLPAFQDLVLSDRLDQISQKSKEIELSCAQTPEARSQVVARHPKWATWPSDLAKTQSSAIHRETLARLKAVRAQIPFTKACVQKQKWNPIVALSPRRSMPGQFVFKTSTEQSVMTTLSPHCFKSLRKGLANFYEDYACFGGDLAMNQDLESAFGAGKHRQVALAAQMLTQSALDKPPGARLEVASILSDLSPELGLRQVMALLAAMGTSGNSGMTGWMQSLEDRWLLEGLLSGQSAAKIYSDFQSLQAAKANYIGLRDLVDQKQLKLTLKGRVINAWNRHNLMAAYLGCHFSTLPRERVLKTIANIGVAYESKDFVSHLMSGVSIQNSVRNFKQDTHRYATAGAIGYGLCEQL